MLFFRILLKCIFVYIKGSKLRWFTAVLTIGYNKAKHLKTQSRNPFYNFLFRKKCKRLHFKKKDLF
jgi:hypothetical protein